MSLSKTIPKNDLKKIILFSLFIALPKLIFGQASAGLLQTKSMVEIEIERYSKHLRPYERKKLEAIEIIVDTTRLSSTTVSSYSTRDSISIKINFNFVQRLYNNIFITSITGSLYPELSNLSVFYTSNWDLLYDVKPYHFLELTEDKEMPVNQDIIDEIQIKFNLSFSFIILHELYHVINYHSIKQEKYLNKLNHLSGNKRTRIIGKLNNLETSSDKFALDKFFKEFDSVKYPQFYTYPLEFYIIGNNVEQFENRHGGITQLKRLVNLLESHIDMLDCKTQKESSFECEFLNLILSQRKFNLRVFQELPVQQFDYDNIKNIMANFEKTDAQLIFESYLKYFYTKLESKEIESLIKTIINRAKEGLKTESSEDENGNIIMEVPFYEAELRTIEYLNFLLAKIYEVKVLDKNKAIDHYLEAQEISRFLPEWYYSNIIKRISN